MYIDRSYLGNQSYCNEIFVIKKIMTGDCYDGRLLFSNAYSALYVMSSDREPATLNKLLKFMKQEYKNIT